MAKLVVTKEEFADIVGLCKGTGCCDNCVLSALGCKADSQHEFDILCSLVEINDDGDDR